MAKLRESGERRRKPLILTLDSRPVSGRRSEQTGGERLGTGGKRPADRISLQPFASNLQLVPTGRFTAAACRSYNERQPVARITGAKRGIRHVFDLRI